MSPAEYTVGTARDQNRRNVLNTTEVTEAIAVKDCIPARNPCLDLLTQVKRKTATSPPILMAIKEPAAMSEITAHPKSPTTSQESQVICIIVPTVILYHLKQVLMPVLP